MKPMKWFEIATLILLGVTGISGCYDSSKREAAALRADLDVVTARTLIAIQEKEKVEAEIVRQRAEIATANERLADTKAQVDALRSENLFLRESVEKVERRASAADASVVAERAASKSKQQEFERQQSELREEIALLKQKAESKKGTLSGVVTYFFNNNFGYKPDIGSEVMLVSKAASPEFDFSVVEKFVRVNRIRTLRSLENYTAVLFAKRGTRTPTPTPIAAGELKKAGIANESDWEALTKQADDMWSTAERGNKTIKLVADGNGSFKRSIPPGEYYVLIRSKQRSGSNTLEILGKVHAEKVVISYDEEVSVSAKFEAN